MKDLLDKIFPTLSDELIIVISLIIGLLVTASLILFLVKKIFPKTNISELAARTRSWWIMAGLFLPCISLFYRLQRTLFGTGIQRSGSRSIVLGHTSHSHSILPCLPGLVWSLYHIHSGSHVPCIAFTTGFKGRHAWNYQVDGPVAMDSDAFGIRYQSPCLSPVASRTTGIQFRRTRSAVVPCIPYRNK